MTSRIRFKPSGDGPPACSYRLTEWSDSEEPYVALYCKVEQFYKRAEELLYKYKDVAHLRWQLGGLK